MYITAPNKPTSNEKLVQDILMKHLKLLYLKDALEQNIKTLDDDLLKEQGLAATLDLLSQHSCIELLIDKIKKTKPTEAPPLPPPFNLD